MAATTIALALLLPVPQAFAQDAGAGSGADSALVQLGPGDGLNLSVYGQPDMGGPLVVSESGSISIPLVGTVSVKGLSPAAAARRVEQALRDGQFLNDPHVTLTLTQELSQRVSVLGEVGKPGRYAIQNDTTLLDLIAQAGGITSAGGDVVYLLRTQQDGQVSRQEIKLGGFSRNQGTLVTGKLQAGDTYVVPKADTYYIYGQVTSPNMYRMESGMTVIQAVARAGGVTARGSEHRIEIKRTLPDGKVKTFGASANDPVEPNDVIRVKESIF